MKVTNTQSLIESSKIRFPNKFKYDFTIFTRSNLKVQIECVKHGIFEQTPNSHLNKQSSGRMYSMPKTSCFIK